MHTYVNVGTMLLWMCYSRQGWKIAVGCVGKRLQDFKLAGDAPKALHILIITRGPISGSGALQILSPK